MLRTLIDIPLFADIAPLALSPAWIVLVSAVLFVVYLTFRPKRRDPLASQPFRTSLAAQKSLERDMQNVIVELSEMSRQMSAQLETRAVKLEQLMRDADAKIAQLQQVQQAADAARTSIETSGEANAGEFTAIASDTVSTSMQPARPAMRLVTDDTSHTEDRWAEVYRLGDEGLTLPEIARRLARPNGEVELILALRPKAPASANRDTPSTATSDLAQAL
jgi:hypothetical protein